MGHVRFMRKGSIHTAPAPKDLTVQQVNSLTVNQLQQIPIKQLDAKEETT